MDGGSPFVKGVPILPSVQRPTVVCQGCGPDLTKGEVPGTIYGLSQKVWVDGELFDLWFSRHFLLHTPPVYPLLVDIHHIISQL